jgi:hypothetical protein
VIGKCGIMPRIALPSINILVRTGNDPWRYLPSLNRCTTNADADNKTLYIWLDLLCYNKNTSADSYHADMHQMEKEFIFSVDVGRNLSLLYSFGIHELRRIVLRIVIIVFTMILTLPVT